MQENMETSTKRTNIISIIVKINIFQFRNAVHNSIWEELTESAMAQFLGNE